MWPLFQSQDRRYRHVSFTTGINRKVMLANPPVCVKTAWWKHINYKKTFIYHKKVSTPAWGGVSGHFKQTYIAKLPFNPCKKCKINHEKDRRGLTTAPFCYRLHKTHTYASTDWWWLMQRRATWISILCSHFDKNWKFRPSFAQISWWIPAHSPDRETKPHVCLLKSRRPPPLTVHSLIPRPAPPPYLSLTHPCAPFMTYLSLFISAFGSLLP